jgi:hypothetical protein
MLRKNWRFLDRLGENFGDFLVHVAELLYFDSESPFFRHFFGENYLKILTLAPGGGK